MIQRLCRSIIARPTGLLYLGAVCPDGASCGSPGDRLRNRRGRVTLRPGHVRLAQGETAPWNTSTGIMFVPQRRPIANFSESRHHIGGRFRFVQFAMTVFRLSPAPIQVRWARRIQRRAVGERAVQMRNLIPCAALAFCLASCSQEIEYTDQQRSCIAQRYASYDARQLSQCVDVCKACMKGNTVTCNTSCRLRGAS
jgi:hypothetical protein